MPTPTKGPRLGGTPAHERIILDNLASQLFEHGKITTTEAKAKRVRPLAEKLITKAKRGDLHARRLAATHIRDKGVLHVLFAEIAPAVAEREGGYTRITKVGPRKGDNAPMAVIEVITEAPTKKAKPERKAAPAPAASSNADQGGATQAPAADQSGDDQSVVTEADAVREDDAKVEAPADGATQGNAVRVEDAEAGAEDEAKDN